MEMPETKPNLESRKILGQILTKAFDADDQTPFDELLKKCNAIPYAREVALDEANNRLERLLGNQANSEFQRT